MKLKNILTVICFIIIVYPLSADRNVKTGKAVTLTDGAVAESTIDLSSNFGIPAQTFSFRVPKNAYGVRISLSGAEADLDLFVNEGSAVENFSLADMSSEGDVYNESLFITRQSEVPLEAGIYYVSVIYQYDYLPLIDGKRAEKLDFSIGLEIIKAEPELVLVPGKTYSLKLKPENGMFAVAAVDIPRGTDEFRIDVFDTDADIDIFASMRAAAKSREEALYVAEGLLGSESLVIRGYPDSRLQSGRYYISLLDQLAKDLPRELSIIVTLGADAPDQISYIPKMPEPDDSFESALLSTVEIISDGGKGSGCLLSRSGHVVTNWHVVKGADGNPSPGIYAAVSLSKYKPPKELFSAVLLDYDEALDLALLKITGGRYGQDLSFGYDFPYFRLGNPEEIRIGQPLGVLGYPEVGGTGSRTSITFTSGIVSGFEAAGDFSLIKTDALISSGNSGGAVINAYYELLGIPGYIMDINNDKMGYVYPVSSFPADWVRQIEKANNE